MRTCIKCGELNGTGRDTCWKCGADLKDQGPGLEQQIKKVCPKCGLIYPRQAETCEKCGGPLSVHSEEAERIVEQEKRSQPKVPYLLCFLMPLLGAYYELKAGLEGDLAEKTAIRIASGAGTVVWVLLILMACWIAGAFSPNPDAEEAGAALESFFSGCIRPFL